MMTTKSISAQVQSQATVPLGGENYQLLSATDKDRLSLKNRKASFSNQSFEADGSKKDSFTLHNFRREFSMGINETINRNKEGSNKDEGDNLTFAPVSEGYVILTFCKNHNN